MTRLSRQGLAVLETLAQQPACWFPISYLVGRFLAAHGSSASTRASLSRTLRRLWRAGFVELRNDWAVTLTEHCTAIDDELAGQERDPDAAFARELTARQGAPGFFPFTTAEDWLRHQRYVAGERKRCKPMCAVCLTAAGQELVKRLIACCRGVNRSEPSELLNTQTSNGQAAGVVSKT